MRQVQPFMVYLTFAIPESFASKSSFGLLYFVLQWAISLCTHMNLSSNTSAILISLVRLFRHWTTETFLIKTKFSNRRETSRWYNGFSISNNLQCQLNSNFKIIKGRYFSCRPIFWSYSKWRRKFDFFSNQGSVGRNASSLDQICSRIYAAST